MTALSKDDVKKLQLLIEFNGNCLHAQMRCSQCPLREHHNCGAPHNANVKAVEMLNTYMMELIVDE